ncbi:hypothetical protein [Dendronalium sp. ChiSLP03b]|uniref:hypothetical protein n=1 Tax=Dendronalium sp. ChiSLP03b TaxID=3075381 RepID=UPI00391C3B38
MVRGLESKNQAVDFCLWDESEDKPKNKLEEIAAEAIKLAGLTVRIGEYEFVSTAVRLLEPFISAWYRKAELDPPSTATISRWFYTSPPKWAIALLVNEKEKIFQKLSPKC